jgi:hypothetical protein
MRIANRLMGLGGAAVIGGAAGVYARWPYEALPVGVARAVTVTGAVVVPVATLVLGVGAAISAWTLWHDPSARTRWNVTALTLGGPAAVMLNAGMFSVGAELAQIYARLP